MSLRFFFQAQPRQAFFCVYYKNNNRKGNKKINHNFERILTRNVVEKAEQYLQNALFPQYGYIFSLMIGDVRQFTSKGINENAKC